MRRFSQRNSLVTLNEINITPLLDLAFVLLIIFVITRPLIEQNLDMQLPQNNSKVLPQDMDPRNIRLVEINSRGQYWMGGKYRSISELEGDLAQVHRQNPRLIVDLRTDKRCQYDYVYAVIDFCTRNGMRLSLLSQPVNH